MKLLLDAVEDEKISDVLARTPMNDPDIWDFESPHFWDKELLQKKVRQGLTIKQLVENVLNDIYLSFVELYRKGMGVDDAQWQKAVDTIQDDIVSERKDEERSKRLRSNRKQEDQKQPKESPTVQEMSQFKALKEWIATAEDKTMSVSSDLSSATIFVEGKIPVESFYSAASSKKRGGIGEDWLGGLGGAIQSETQRAYRHLFHRFLEQKGIDHSTFRKAVRSQLE